MLYIPLSVSEEGGRILADIVHQEIAVVAIQEQIDTRDSSAAGRYFRRAMLALGAYQVDATSERTKLGLDRARAEGKRGGARRRCPKKQVEQCRRQ